MLGQITKLELCLVVVLMTIAAGAQDYKANPRELVRKATANQESSPGPKLYFIRKDTKRTKTGEVQTREIVDTPQLVLARLVAINGQPLNEEQRAKENGRLNRLITDPDELAKKKKEQQNDDARVRRMVRAIPDAFQFQYAGTEPQKDGGEVVVLNFSPDPNWDPPTRELAVFTGMSGTIKIAVPENRVTLMQAKLFKDVEFGWGILGKLYKGGDFMIQQGEVYPKYWDLTHLKLHFTGKVLLFKSLNIQQDEQLSDFRPVPQMTVAQALDKLKEVDVEYAKNTAANGGGK